MIRVVNRVACALIVMVIEIYCMEQENLVLLPITIVEQKLGSELNNKTRLPIMYSNNQQATSSGLVMRDTAVYINLVAEDSIVWDKYAELFERGELLIALVVTKVDIKDQQTYIYALYHAQSLNDFLFTKDYTYNRYGQFKNKLFLDPLNGLPISDEIFYFIVKEGNAVAEYVGTDHDCYLGYYAYFFVDTIEITDTIKAYKKVFEVLVLDHSIAHAKLLGSHCFYRRDFEQAEYWWSVAAAKGDEQSMANLGTLYWSHFNSMDGAKYYWHCAIKNSKCCMPSIKKYLGNLYFKERDWKQAKEYLGDVQIAPDLHEQPIVLFKMAYIARREEDFDRAQQLLLSVYKNSFTSTELRIKTLESLCYIPDQKLMQDVKAMHFGEQLFASEVPFFSKVVWYLNVLAKSGNQTAQLIMGKIFYKKALYSKALEYLEPLACGRHKLPHEFFALLPAGRSYYKLLNSKEAHSIQEHRMLAQKYLVDAREEYPGRAYYYLGKLFEKYVQDSGQARYYYTLAVSHASLKAKLRLANLLFTAHEYEKARELCTQAKQQAYFPAQKVKVEKLQRIVRLANALSM